VRDAAVAVVGELEWACVAVAWAAVCAGVLVVRELAAPQPVQPSAIITTTRIG
jgi:hypothetical protein